MLVESDEIQAISVEAFEAMNARCWEANTSLWCEAGGATSLRNAMLAEVDAAIAREIAQAAGAPSLADLGCGDGGYLVRLRRAGFAGALNGVDFCPALIARARSACPDARLEVADLAGTAPLPLTSITVATCLLTLIEIARYARAIVAAHRVLRPRGLFVLSLLDPTVEVLRFIALKRGRPGTQLYDVEGEFAIGSLFEVQGQVSPAPSFRFLRPIDIYVEALLESGFVLERVVSVQGTGYPFQVQPRAVILCARKQPVVYNGTADDA